jgi:ATP-dependent Clp protease ATP-binding subunit ClpA
MLCAGIRAAVLFHALDEKNIAGIAKIQLKYLEKRMAKLDMALEVSDAALACWPRPASTRCSARGR